MTLFQFCDKRKGFCYLFLRILKLSIFNPGSSVYRFQIVYRKKHTAVTAVKYNGIIFIPIFLKLSSRFHQRFLIGWNLASDGIKGCLIPEKQTARIGNRDRHQLSVYRTLLQHLLRKLRQINDIAKLV